MKVLEKRSFFALIIAYAQRNVNILYFYKQGFEKANIDERQDVC